MPPILAVGSPRLSPSACSFATWPLPAGRSTGYRPGGYNAALLGLEDHEARILNDDKVGWALDQLFAADRASLLTALSLSVIRRFGIEVNELHNDSTSITLYGAYRQATGTLRAGVRPPVLERGFSKDHRGDLLQLVEILTVSADGAVPIAHRLADGAT